MQWDQESFTTLQHWCVQSPCYITKSSRYWSTSKSFAMLFWENLGIAHGQAFGSWTKLGSKESGKWKTKWAVRVLNENYVPCSNVLKLLAVVCSSDNPTIQWSVSPGIVLHTDPFPATDFVPTIWIAKKSGWWLKWSSFCTRFESKFASQIFSRSSSKICSGYQIALYSAAFLEMKSCQTTRSSPSRTCTFLQTVPLCSSVYLVSETESEAVHQPLIFALSQIINQITYIYAVHIILTKQ